MSFIKFIQIERALGGDPSLADLDDLEDLEDMMDEWELYDCEQIQAWSHGNLQLGLNNLLGEKAYEICHMPHCCWVEP